jgi:hypothetical protein
VLKPLQSDLDRWEYDYPDGLPAYDRDEEFLEEVGNSYPEGFMLINLVFPANIVTLCDDII